MNSVEIIFIFSNIINTYVIFRLMHLFAGERKYSKNRNHILFSILPGISSMFLFNTYSYYHVDR